MAEDNYQYQPKPLPSWTPIGSESLSASQSGFVEIGGINVSPPSLESPFSNPDFTGGGGGIPSTCASTQNVGTLNVTQINLPCSGPTGSITEDSIALEAGGNSFTLSVSGGILQLLGSDTNITIDLSSIPEGAGVISIREYELCEGQKIAVLASAPY